MTTLFVKMKLNKSYDYWLNCFEAHKEVRLQNGIKDIMVKPVIGEQAAMYVVEAERPRMVLDMMYGDDALEFVLASGHVIGEEVVTICE